MTSASLILYGCTAYPVTIETAPPPAARIVVRPGRTGVVVAAPHGTSDPDTGQVADEIARRTGFGLVIVTGFTLEVGSEGRNQYERRVVEVSRGPLRFYVEIHGNGRTEHAGRIEIATVGVDREHALQLKTLLELVRDAHVRGRAGVPRLEILVEPVDRLFHAASWSTREGILRPSERALHIELPRSARREFRDVYTPMLAEFLAQAASLRPLREPVP